MFVFAADLWKPGRSPTQMSEELMSEQDVRYWMLGEGSTQDMETAVLDQPRNTDMWLRLAYRKLQDTSGRSVHNWTRLYAVSVEPN